MSQRIVASHKHPAYQGARIYLLDLVTPEGRSTGETLVALDMVDAGVGDLVLACSEGHWAREHFGAESPVRSTIVAVVVEVEIEIDSDRRSVAKAQHGGTQGS